MTPWHEEAITRTPDLSAFTDQDENHTYFLQKEALRSHNWNALKTFLALPNPDGRSVLGFYSLGVTRLEMIAPGAEVKDRQRLGFRLAYLGVDRRLGDLDFAGQLLLAAGRRCILASAKVGGDLLLITPEATRTRLLARYGPVPLRDVSGHLVLPLATIRVALQEAKDQCMRTRAQLDSQACRDANGKA